MNRKFCVTGHAERTNNTYGAVQGVYFLQFVELQTTDRYESPSIKYKLVPLVLWNDTLETVNTLNHPVVGEYEGTSRRLQHSSMHSAPYGDNKSSYQQTRMSVC